jgi:hypothetical protein
MMQAEVESLLGAIREELELLLPSEAEAEAVTTPGR